MKTGLNEKDTKTVNRALDELEANRDKMSMFEFLRRSFHIQVLIDVFRILPTE